MCVCVCVGGGGGGGGGGGDEGWGGCFFIFAQSFEELSSLMRVWVGVPQYH